MNGKIVLKVSLNDCKYIFRFHHMQIFLLYIQLFLGFIRGEIPLPVSNVMTFWQISHTWNIISTSFNSNLTSRVCRFHFTGSWFVQALCYVLQRDRIHRDGQQRDLLSCLTRVARKVAFDFQSNTPGDYVMHEKKQIPCITSMLTRDIIFAPKPWN